ncbi:transcriptional regulator (plasmid) [Acetobacter orientalis]|uniref:Transcriptional regulator n=1 Tax=Acetobacter orientalis TaxID=146474 RepID=A0A2Z5ZMQ1_9PROT|nr:transcriptional regulator [Acetobacter orientalis]
MDLLAGLCDILRAHGSIVRSMASDMPLAFRAALSRASGDNFSARDASDLRFAISLLLFQWVHLVQVVH